MSGVNWFGYGGLLAGAPGRWEKSGNRSHLLAPWRVSVTLWAGQTGKDGRGRITFNLLIYTYPLSDKCDPVLEGIGFRLCLGKTFVWVESAGRWADGWETKRWLAASLRS